MALWSLVDAVHDAGKIAKPLRLPLATEALVAGLAGEELLHGGLFEVAILGDEPVQPVQQPIHIAQRRCDSALFGKSGRQRDWRIPQRLMRKVSDCCSGELVVEIQSGGTIF